MSGKLAYCLLVGLTPISPSSLSDGWSDGGSRDISAWVATCPPYGGNLWLPPVTEGITTNLILKLDGTSPRSMLAS